MYTETKKVREMNGDQFVNDFKRLYSIGMITKSGDFFHIKKSELWKVAKGEKITYYLTDKIFVSKRTTMVIV